MNQTTTTPVTSEPDLHPTWARALAEPMTFDLALELAEDVCAVLLERDWLLVIEQGSCEALERVIAPAANLMLGSRAQAALSAVEHGQAPNHPQRHRLAFAALCTTAAHLAYASGHHESARTYAAASLVEGPDAVSARLADLVATLVAIGCPFESGGPGLRKQVAHEVVAARASR